MKQIFLFLFCTFSLGASQQLPTLQIKQPIYKFIINNQEDVLRYGVVLPASSDEGSSEYSTDETRNDIESTLIKQWKVISEIRSKTPGPLTHFFLNEYGYIMPGEPKVKYANQSMLDSDPDDCDDSVKESSEDLSKYVPIEIRGQKVAELLNKFKDKSSVEDKMAEEAAENPYIIARRNNGIWCLQARASTENDSGIIELNPRQKVRITDYLQNLVKANSDKFELRYSDIPTPK